MQFFHPGAGSINSRAAIHGDHPILSRCCIVVDSHGVGDSSLVDPGRGDVEAEELKVFAVRDCGNIYAMCMTFQFRILHGMWDWSSMC